MTSSTPTSDSEYPFVLNKLPHDPELEAAPFGYEPEGSSCCGESISEDDTLKSSSYSKWFNNLPSLLNSKSGLKAFQRFLEKSNMNHFQMLRFLFACKGVSESKEQSEKEVLLKVIYQTFISKNVFDIEKSQRDVVVAHFEENKRGEPLSANIFHDICRDIEEKMKTEMYPNFLTYQAEKLQRSKSSSRSNHDCKKHFFEQRRSTHCQSKPAGRVIDAALLEHAKPPEPETFYKVLMQRLEKVKNEEEDKTKVYRSQPDEIPPLRDVLARVISEKVEDNNYEDILDQHIDRVLPDDENNASSNYDLHKYSESKKFNLAKKPVMFKDPYTVPHPYNGTGPVRQRSKDVYSMFSSDSGFGTGYYSDETRRDSDHVPSERYQPRKVSETWASRQTLADSGTGMMSEEEYIQYNEKMHERRDKCRSHVSEGNKYRMNHASEAEKYRMNHLSEGDVRYKQYNFNMMSYRDRHSFINDIPSVSMNSIHSIDSYAQAEEERRRKLRNEMRQKLKSPSWSENSHPGQPVTGYSKNRMENMQQRADDSAVTTVVYNFSDESLPYRVKVPGSRITLKQFKEFMPKKGSYRYFFITPCEDLGAVQEEITDEHRELPLWEGKVDARIKTIK